MAEGLGFGDKMYNILALTNGALFIYHLKKSFFTKIIGPHVTR